MKTALFQQNFESKVKKLHYSTDISKGSIKISGQIEWEQTAQQES